MHRKKKPIRCLLFLNLYHIFLEPPHLSIYLTHTHSSGTDSCGAQHYSKDEQGQRLLAAHLVLLLLSGVKEAGATHAVA